MSERRQQWRHDRDDHMTEEEIARAEGRFEMIERPLEFVEEEAPPVASEAEPQERRW